MYGMGWAGAFTVGPWLGTEVLTRYGPVACWGGTLALALAAGLFMARLGATRTTARTA